MQKVFCLHLIFLTLHNSNDNQKYMFQEFIYDDLKATCECAFFCPHKGVDEAHVMVHVAALNEPFAGQLARLKLTVGQLMQKQEMKDMQIVAERYFLSDIANQSVYFAHLNDRVDVSLIQQPPLDGSKVALWLYMVRGKEGAPVVVAEEDCAKVVATNNYRMLFHWGMQNEDGDSAEQTHCLLKRYADLLAAWDGNIADHCVRTWFYVRDIDTQYAGMVKARLEDFEQMGLTSDTHYIASTGIQGLPSKQKALVQLGAMAILGLEEGQLRYLYAPTHLNPTYEYGVTFERGTVVRFGDREHAYISGTASIDNKGQVVAVGDIKGQTLRMIENVEVLLKEADMAFDDVMQIVVYLRDIADYDVVKKILKEKLPSHPMVVTLAPVCRPQWLIEMECIAVKGAENKEYRAL